MSSNRVPLSDPIFRRISRLADAQGVRAFVVGGYVRDYYLRRPSTDIDVVVVGSGIALAEALGRELKARVSVFKTFGTAMVRAGRVEVEFVGARKESYTHDSRKPHVEAGRSRTTSGAATSRSTPWPGRSTATPTASWSIPSTACPIWRSARYARRAIPTSPSRTTRCA